MNRANIAGDFVTELTLDTLKHYKVLFVPQVEMISGETALLLRQYVADGGALWADGRCGWLDAFMLRYSARLNSLDYLAITRLDILDQMPKIKMCVGYKIGDEVLKRIPASLNVLAKVEPIFEEFDGWMTDISGIRNYDELPENAKKYLAKISEVSGVELGIISVGPNREQTIVLKELL